MAEYVTKEQVKEEILSWARCINKHERLVTEDAMYVIDALPSVDVRPVVRGRWEHLNWGFDYDRCSVCEYEHRWPGPFYFCPNCGADMRGGDAECPE